ncbi:hypothetical protein BHE74_00008094 [Ensete ventricosum]|nr:hypothetical protein BHE74_00008094 [Ensete ventricosum]
MTGRQAPTASTSIHSLPDPDTLSFDSLDSLRAQLRLMNQYIDKIQKEFIKSKEELGESSMGGSPFVPEGIPNAHPLLVIQAFLIGLRSSHFFWSLVEHPPMAVPKMLQIANQYVVAEVLVAGKREDKKRPRVESSRGSPATLKKKNGVA